MFQKKIKNYNNKIQFIIGLANNINLKKFDIPSWIKIENKYPQKALECGDLALIASGTSTIESAVFGTPMLIVYKMNYLSWILAKMFVKVNFAGMVNIIAKKEIMPEFLQNHANKNSIAKKIINIFNTDNKLQEMKSELLYIKEKLKSDNPSKQAANHIISLLNKKKFEN